MTSNTKSSSSTLLSPVDVRRGRVGNPKPIHTYTEDQKAETLAALALNGGNISATTRAMGVPQSTVRKWRDGQFGNRNGISEAVSILRDAKVMTISEKLEALVNRGLDSALRGKMIEDADLKSLIVAVGVGIDKLQMLQGQSREGIVITVIRTGEVDAEEVQ